MAETSDLLSKRLFAIKNQRMGGDTEELALIIGELRLKAKLIGRRQEFDVCVGERMCRCLSGARHHVQGASGLIGCANVKAVVCCRCRVAKDINQ